MVFAEGLVKGTVEASALEAWWRMAARAEARGEFLEADRCAHYYNALWEEFNEDD